jgi:hypothetical protein
MMPSHGSQLTHLLDYGSAGSGDQSEGLGLRVDVNEYVRRFPDVGLSGILGAMDAHGRAWRLGVISLGRITLTSGEGRRGA